MNTTIAKTDGEHATNSARDSKAATRVRTAVAAHTHTRLSSTPKCGNVEFATPEQIQLVEE